MKPRARLLLPAGWLLCMLAGTLLPWRVKIVLGTWRRQYRIWPGITLNPHRLLHILSFGIATLLLLWCLRAWRTRAAATFAMLLLAFGTEYAEHSIYLNPYEWNDVRDDASGVVFAGLVMLARSGSSSPAASEK